MKNYQLPASTAFATESLVPGAASDLEVNISTDLASVDVMHHGRKVTIMRHQIWYRGDMQDWESLGPTTLKPL